MIEIECRNLCFVGNGNKIHIKYNNQFTYCASEIGTSLKEKGLVGITEKAKDLCLNCLREYKKVKEK